MFYAQAIFVQRGPLANVWKAAHEQARKISKLVVKQTNIAEQCKRVLDTPSPLALRVSGSLLLGIARIYQRKIKFLQDDCNNALTKIKMVFRPGAVDLSAEAARAPTNTITYAENLGAIDLDVEDLPLEYLLQANDEGLAVSFSVDPADITMQPEVSMKEPIFNEEDLNLDGGQLLEEDIELGNEDISMVEQPRRDSLQPEDELDLTLDQVDNVELPRRDSLVPDTLDEGEVSLIVADEPKARMSLDMSGLGEEEVEASAAQPKQRRRKRKRPPKMDETTEINRKEMRQNLTHTEDLLADREMVRLSKRARLSEAVDNFKLFLTHPSALGGGEVAPEILQVFKKSTTDKPSLHRLDTVVEEEEEEEREEAPPELPELPQEEMFEEPLVLPEEEIRSIPDEERFGELDEAPFFDTQQTEPEEGRPGWSSRTHKMLQFLSNHMENRDELGFESIVHSSDRRTAAGIFHELLVLMSHGVVDLVQPEAFGDITIRKADKFEANAV